MVRSAETTEERYVSLCDRAVDFVGEQGGLVSEDTLITHVFGSRHAAALWRPLLRRLLQPDERLECSANGEWCLTTLDHSPDPTAAIAMLGDFVALDVETTGLKPSQHRIIQIALIRYVNGREVRAYEHYLNPDRPIPEFISRLTGITQAHVTDAPRFPEIAREVQDFIGDALMIGHNVRFDIGFLNAELRRADHDRIVNESLDTMGLAVRLLRTLRKPSLDRVADAVGLAPRRIHRAGGDARLTAEIALRLAHEARARGIRSLDQLKASGHVITPGVRDDVGRARAVMDRTLAQTLPKRPGCYIMRDAAGEIIYIGKAVNLRNRVSSYYSQPIGYTRKMDGLIDAVSQIDHVVVGSELEALLLEAQLIRRFAPRYNTALKKSEHYPYIKVETTNPWPKVSVVRSWQDDGNRYFGPYRSATSARKTVDVINSVLPLRTCSRSFRSAASYGKPCLALELHQCLGPCVGRADADDYRRMIDDVVRYLDGEDDALHARLHADLEDAAARLDFEKAERIRKALRAVMTITDEQKRLRDAEALHNLVLVLPSADDACRECLLVIRGRLWAQLRVSRLPTLEAAPHDEPDDPTSVIPEAADRIARSIDRAAAMARTPPDRDAVDLASILNRFLFRNAGHAALVTLEVDAAGRITDDPAAIIRRALSLTDDDLATLDARKPAADNDEPVNLNPEAVYSG